MKGLDPYLSYAAITSHLPNKDFMKAYDCRFLFVLSGEGELITEEKSFLLKKNTLAYYPAGLAYFLKSDDENPISFVTVNFDFTRTYPRRTPPFGPVKPSVFLPNKARLTHAELGDEWFHSAFTVDNAFSLREDFVSLASFYKDEGIFKDEACAAFLKYLILKIASNLRSEKQENKIVRQVIDYIGENCDGELDNKHIATHFGYHPYYLSALFKSHTQKTLHQYVYDTRLKIAVDMLLHTDATIAEVAEKCGFRNANHFSVKFKQKYGQSPSVWRTLNAVI